MRPDGAAPPLAMRVSSREGQAEFEAPAQLGRTSGRHSQRWPAEEVGPQEDVGGENHVVKVWERLFGIDAAHITLQAIVLDKHHRMGCARRRCGLGGRLGAAWHVLSTLAAIRSWQRQMDPEV